MAVPFLDPKFLEYRHGSPPTLNTAHGRVTQEVFVDVQIDEWLNGKNNSWGCSGGVLDFPVPVAILQNIPNSSLQKNVHLNVKLNIL